MDNQAEAEEETDELVPLKILYLFNKLTELNNYLIKTNIDNYDVQFFLNNMSGLSYNTILVVITNLIDQYQSSVKDQEEEDS